MTSICYLNSLFWKLDWFSGWFGCSHVQPIMFVVYDDGVPLLPWNLKDNAGPLLHHVAPMPLKSLPPPIRTSGTPHHVMWAVCFLHYLDGFVCDCASWFGCKVAHEPVLEGVQFLGDGWTWLPNIQVGSSKQANAGHPMPLICTSSCFLCATKKKPEIWILIRFPVKFF